MPWPEVGSVKEVKLTKVHDPQEVWLQPSSKPGLLPPSPGVIRHADHPAMTCCCLELPGSVWDRWSRRSLICLSASPDVRWRALVLQQKEPGVFFCRLWYLVPGETIWMCLGPDKKTPSLSSTETIGKKINDELSGPAAPEDRLDHDCDSSCLLQEELKSPPALSPLLSPQAIPISTSTPIQDSCCPSLLLREEQSAHSSSSEVPASPISSCLLQEELKSPDATSPPALSPLRSPQAIPISTSTPIQDSCCPSLLLREGLSAHSSSSEVPASPAEQHINPPSLKGFSSKKKRKCHSPFYLLQKYWESD